MEFVEQSAALRDYSSAGSGICCCGADVVELEAALFAQNLSESVDWCL